MAAFDENTERWGLSHITNDLGEGTSLIKTCSLDHLLSEISRGFS